jgi:outer membrane receptor protein involved in Fe transport
MILPSFFVLDASLSYETERVTMKLEINNLTDDIYYSSGAPVDVDFDGVNDEPGYFVNAGRNLFLTMTYKL